VRAWRGHVGGLMSCIEDAARICFGAIANYVKSAWVVPI